MAGPKSASIALKCAKEAITAGRFIPSVHFGRRLGERAIDMIDIHTAIDRSNRAEPYKDGIPVNDGTCWRIIGPDCDGSRIIGVGIEVFAGVDRRPWITLCTVVIV
jgi:hypothetical protein